MPVIIRVVANGCGDGNSAITTDQRGALTRGSGADIGSVEAAPNRSPIFSQPVTPA
jgi:hypothetical protein